MAGDATVLWAGRPERLTRTELTGDVLGLRARVPPGSAVVARTRHAPLVAAALSSLDGWARSVELMPPEAPSTATDPDAVLLTDENLASAGGSAGQTGPPATIATAWLLRTSGTTGPPQLARHTFASLSATIRRAGTSGRRWGLLYPPTRMAGLQVLLQALVAGEEVCDATHLDGLGQQVAWLTQRGVDALSATPTLWRQILQSQAGPGLPLRQVTLGGEIATQHLLDALRRTYPQGRITHVYATTETGSVFAISDGRAGFPASLLDAGPPTGGRRRLLVRDGVLRVSAPWSSAADPDGFVTTGDLVQIDGDRVHFAGRTDGLVNVGGQKVLPEQTEAVLMTHERVAGARVTARPNALAGSILVADVVLTGTGPVDVGRLTSELRALVSRRLSKAHAPARVAVVAELPVTPTWKTARP